MTLHYGEALIEFECRRSERQNTKLRIHVEPDGRVIVDAPGQVSTNALKAGAMRRAGWIHRQVEAARARSAGGDVREWVSGESQRYLGRR